MFSSRLDWGDLQPNSLTLLLQSKRRAGSKVLDLTESNPTSAGLEYPAGIIQSLSDPRSLFYDPAPAGSPEARAAVAAYYAERGQPVAPAQILLTASTSEAYAYLFKLLADPGDEVLVPRPSYPLFEFLAALESVRVTSYPVVYHDGWSIDCGSLAQAVTERTRAIVLVNPNNPTGAFLKQDELTRIVDVAQAHGLALICDEVFADYAFKPDPARVASLVSVNQVLTFSLSGLSKVAGLPQMKVAWIAASGPERLRSEALNGLELIADTYLSVGTPVQCGLPYLLRAASGVREQIAGRLRGNLAYLRACIHQEATCRILDVEGGWCATLQVPRVRGEEEWVLGLLEHYNVLVQPGFFYDFAAEAFLVLSLLTPSDVFEEGVRRTLHFAEPSKGNKIAKNVLD